MHTSCTQGSGKHPRIQILGLSPVKVVPFFMLTLRMLRDSGVSGVSWAWGASGKVACHHERACWCTPQGHPEDSITDCIGGWQRLCWQSCYTKLCIALTALPLRNEIHTKLRVSERFRVLITGVKCPSAGTSKCNNRLFALFLHRYSATASCQGRRLSRSRSISAYQARFAGVRLLGREIQRIASAGAAP